jgi:hypothetical protein
VKEEAPKKKMPAGAVKLGGMNLLAAVGGGMPKLKKAKK